MNAKIDIKTPAGKSLEGFPVNVVTQPDTFRLIGLVSEILYGEQPSTNPVLHPSDIITIEILP